MLGVPIFLLVVYYDDVGLMADGVASGCRARKYFQN